MSDTYIRLIPTDRDWQPGAAVQLDSLHYENPIGFARFEISAMNPTRSADELDAGELGQVSDLLGHPVAQIIAHY
ncbi:hypothetical protein [Dactylosporangium sp. NPDC006015]|uniref:hypothetical protein n=1 Tax=Dactylosporangium sp. NPDC006015 TaxID=3154576 RepID=UPI0033A96BC9